MMDFDISFVIAPASNSASGTEARRTYGNVWRIQNVLLAPYLEQMHLNNPWAIC